MSSEDLDELLAGADVLQAAVADHVISRLPTPTMADLSEDLGGLVARFVLERQTAAIKATVVLARESLGHLALPLVRPACEERIWLTYLYGLDRAARDRLLGLISILEGTKAVGAQQQELGTKVMKQLGFPRAFVNQQARTRAEVETELARAGRALDWPDDLNGGLPSTGWLASQTKLDALYQFLYTASSKGVHFSPSEALRSGWSSSLSPDAHVTLMAEQYVAYRTAFSVHWLCSLLLDTAIVIFERGPLAEGEIDDDARQAIEEAAERIGAFGHLPIVTSAEFNLP